MRGAVHLCSCSLCTLTCCPPTLSTTPFFSRSPLHKTKSQLAHRFSMGSSWQSRSAFAQPTRVCPVLHTSTSVTDGGSTISRKCLAATQMFQTAASLVPRALKNVLPPPVHLSWATHSQTHCDAQELGLRGTSETNTFQHSQRRSMTAVTDSASEYHIRFWSRRCELELLRAASTCQCRSASREDHGTRQVSLAGHASSSSTRARRRNRDHDQQHRPCPANTN